MANNRNHPVHTSYLVKSLRVRLMPKISRKEWNEVLKNLREVYHASTIDNGPYMGLSQNDLSSAFMWEDTSQGEKYWARLSALFYH